MCLLELVTGLLREMACVWARVSADLFTGIVCGGARNVYPMEPTECRRYINSSPTLSSGWLVPLSWTAYLQFFTIFKSHVLKKGFFEIFIRTMILNHWDIMLFSQIILSKEPDITNPAYQLFIL